MQIRLKFFLSLVAFLVMVATVNAQQVFVPNEKGEVSAITPEVRALMEAADKVILDTVQDRLNADKKILETGENLRRVIADLNSDSGQILRARMECFKAIDDFQSSRRIVRAATHKAAMMYFDNVIAIQKSGKKLAESDYGKWQDRTLSVVSARPLQESISSVRESDTALDKAMAKDAESFRQFKLKADLEEARDERKLRELQKEIDRLKLK